MHCSSMKDGVNQDLVGQDQVYDLLLNKEIGWKEIIFDLINTEQLDPWDIDIGALADKFFKRMEDYENIDFFISSNVMLAASLLLRIKSEIILNKYIKNIDSILFGREDEEKKTSSFERIELDEDIPDLFPKSPMPRYKKVTLNELIESLNKAINTENRRIKKTIVNQNALRQAGISMPKNAVGIKGSLNSIKGKIIAHFDANVSHKKISYTNFIGEGKSERALLFFPLLQLETNGDIWLDQEETFSEIHIWLKHVFLKHNPDPFHDLKVELENMTKEELVRLNEVSDAEILED